MDTLMDRVIETAPHAAGSTPNERTSPGRNGDVLSLRAVVSEPFGGTAQLLLDMRRAGLNLRSLRLDVEDETKGNLELIIETTPDRPQELVIARLSRFPVVAGVVALDF